MRDSDTIRTRWQRACRNLLPALILAAMAAATVGCKAAAPERDTDIRVSFNDGQLLVGDMTTPTFTLETALGSFDFDPAEIGELGPVEGTDLGQSGAVVALWLRDGSEYSGVWTNPSAAVRVVIGRQPSNVTLPIDNLQRMQFTGSEIWPERKVVRVITSSGNDFLVDAARTQITIVSELGTFSPMLDEIATLTPPAAATADEDDADAAQAKPRLWRAELISGAILLGTLGAESLVVYPSLGPESVTVPQSAIKLIRQELWDQRSLGMIGGAASQQRSRGKWFSNEGFQEQKQTYDKQNQQ